MFRRFDRNKIIEDITKMGFHAFHHEGEYDIVSVSAEDGRGAANYYGDFTDGIPWFNPKLEAYAEKMNCFWEWVNPGCIALYEQ